MEVKAIVRELICVCRAQGGVDTKEVRPSYFIPGHQNPSLTAQLVAAALAVQLVAAALTAQLVAAAPTAQLVAAALPRGVTLLITMLLQVIIKKCPVMDSAITSR